MRSTLTCARMTRGHSPLWVICGMLLAISAFAPQTSARESWELDIDVKKFETVQAKGAQGNGFYLYMVYEVSNDSNQSASLNLSLQVETDVKDSKGKPKTYWNHLDQKVIKHLQKRGVIDQDAKTPSECRTATVDSGQTVTCVAVFGKLDNAADKLELSVGGLKDPVQVRGGKRYVEDVRWIMEYHRPGDEFNRDRSKISLKKSHWKTLKSDEKPYKRA